MTYKIQFLLSFCKSSLAKMVNKALFCVLLVTFATAEGTPLATVRLGEYIKLHCPIHTQGPDFHIKSLTWTKDGEMFYKFAPSQLRFPFLADLDGVEIQDDVYFNGTELVIGPATSITPGFYRCAAELSNPYLYPGLRMSVNIDTRLTLVKKQMKHKPRKW